MQSNIPVSILAGCGIWCLYSPIKEKCSSLGTVLYYGLGVGALIMGAYQIVSINFSLGSVQGDPTFN